MANPTLILGANNWAIEEDNILGYALGSSSNQYLPREISFTRGSDATYTDSTGVIRQACWNLAGYSEEFNNAYWTKQQSSIIANDTVAPDGTLTADRFTEDTSNSNHRIFNGGAITVSNSIASTYSVYLKSAGRTRAWVRDNDLLGALFNLATGTIVSIDASATATITSIADGWYRCTITRINSTSNGRIVIYLDNDTSDSYTGNGTSGIYIWGAQIVQGTQPLAYLRTTDRLNIPRVDSSTGSKAFLLEPQRSNLLVYSNDFTNVSWTKTNIIPTPNVSISPENTTNAHRIFETVNSGNHGLAQQITLSLSTNYTISCYVKKGNRSYCGLQFWFNTTNGVIAFYNLDNGTLVYEFAEGSGYSISNSKIQDVGDGWYRLSSVVQVGITTAYPGIVMASTEWSTGTSYDNSYFGDSSKYMDVYGFQLEAGAYPTTYIPTQASTVTRLADVASKTGISSLIGQTEGVLFVDLQNPSGGDIATFGLNGTNTIFIRGGYDNSWSAGILANSVYYTFTSVNNSASRIKIAIAYKSGDSVLYINGVQTQQITSAFSFTASLSSVIFNPSAFYFAQPHSATYNQAVIFPTRLTNAELAALTTL